MTLGTHDARVAALREALEFYARRGSIAQRALRADDEARGATPDPDAREEAEEWLIDHHFNHLASFFAQPPDVQAAIRDLLGGGA